MPFWMSYCVQSVVVQGKVYVGGGDDGYGSSNNYIIMEYDLWLGEWDTLPPYAARDFAMTTINDQLLLVGGHWAHCGLSKELSVWEMDKKEWTHPYPDMPTARS